MTETKIRMGLDGLPLLESEYGGDNDPEALDENRYGFTWGNMEVTRLTHIEGRGRSLAVRVVGKSYASGLQIYMSEGGRSVRVWKNGKELT